MLDSNKFYIRIVCNIYKEKLEKHKFYIGFGGNHEEFHTSSIRALIEIWIQWNL